MLEAERKGALLACEFRCHPVVRYECRFKMTRIIVPFKIVPCIKPDVQLGEAAAVDVLYRTTTMRL